MYARLSTVSTSRSPQPPVGSFCRNSAISCAEGLGFRGAAPFTGQG